ncbi:CPBP family intramembrane glutamic endopeptidase [Allocoleopsis sp.]|uniref:CPBP family intramembrane glutamic endopeptidase n=1 Tax=Allocoleopsis sp. TaxID=3088169 RepID=UPI002FCEEC20
MLNLQSDNPFLKLKVRYLFIVFFLLILLIGLIGGIIINYTGFNPKDPIIVYIYYCLIFGCFFLWLLRRFRQLKINAKYMIGHFPIGYNWLLVAGLVIAVLICSMGVALLSFYFLSLVAPSFLDSLLKSISASKLQNSSVPILFEIIKTISFIVVAPVTEEFIFRGILLHRFATKWGITPAILVSSFIFGCLHVNPIGLSIFGIMMALLYLKSRTLFVPMAAHAMNNFVALGLQFFSKTSNSHSTNAASSYLWVGLIFLALSAPFLVRFMFKNWPNQRVPLPYFANISRSQASP